MADEPRRSGRATKGQHTKIDEHEAPAPAAKRSKKGATGRSKSSKPASAEPTPSEDDDPNAIIRCICGATEEVEDDDRMMISCDKCEAWQHNECMEVTEDQDKLPDKYLCEQCRPADHKELLAKVARGEKPWEERAKEREKAEEEKRARRRRSGKKGKGGRKSRPSELKSEASEEVNGMGAPRNEDVPMNDNVTDKPPSSSIKPQPLEVKFVPNAPPASGNKRKSRGEEPKHKVRKVSTQGNIQDGSVAPSPISSTAMPAPNTNLTKAFTPQAGLAESISQLPQARQSIANVLMKTFVEQLDQARKAGTYTLAEDQTVEGVATCLGIEVEHALFLNLFGSSQVPSEDYRQKARSMVFNIKKNHALRDQVLQGQITPYQFSMMSSDDMASKELQQRTAEMKKQAEKQHMLVQEEGPRIRRTHKGEELVNDETQNAGSESIFAATPARRRESVADAETSKANSPSSTAPRSPAAIELPEDVPFTGDAGSPTGNKRLSIDTKAPPRAAAPDRKSSAPFNIQDVWSSVTPDAEKQRPIREPTERKASELATKEEEGPGVVADAEIDQLLKDEDVESPPYSPIDYQADPDTIWRGKVSMTNVAEFTASGKHVAGADRSATIPWLQLFPTPFEIDGRIDVQRADEYLCGLRFSQNTDVSVVALSPVGGTVAQAEFDKLFNYFNSRKRYGVIGKNTNSVVRDTYIIPLEAGMEKKPDFIEILEHCIIEEPRSERMLLATFVLRANTTPSAQVTPSAQATPRHLNNRSPRTDAIRAIPHDANVPSSEPSTYNSPYSQYPPPQAPYQPPANPPLTGLAAAQQILGSLVGTPVVEQLLKQVPHIGMAELGVVRSILEREPAARDDLAMLTKILQDQNVSRQS
ncbi:MAG: hypothetical protein M1835_004946 [Candelina submexicana]|nr:MAG: hypothetical protein M1835_004946 [Candelina submexicana]